MDKERLSDILAVNKGLSANIFPFKLNKETTFKLDLGHSNPELADLDITDNEVFISYLRAVSDKNIGKIPVGGYNERRLLYSRSDHFGMGSERRDIHLGIDIWLPEGTPVSAPFDSLVHSFANNTNYRDYGPTIILEHIIKGHTFYTLYGHLSLESLSDMHTGKIIKRAEVFSSIGSVDVNGSWPPHLHFQVIGDMGDMKGDFPGVTSMNDRDKYLELCPDPAYILGLK